MKVEDSLLLNERRLARKKEKEASRFKKYRRKKKSVKEENDFEKIFKKTEDKKTRCLVIKSENYH